MYHLLIGINASLITSMHNYKSYDLSGNNQKVKDQSAFSLIIYLELFGDFICWHKMVQNILPLFRRACKGCLKNNLHALFKSFQSKYLLSIFTCNCLSYRRILKHKLIKIRRFYIYIQIIVDLWEYFEFSKRFFFKN